VLSSTSFAELLSYAVETTDVPKFFRDIKKMPKEDQQGWINACDDEIKSLAERKVWKLVDLPQNCRTVKCRWVLVRKADGHKKVCLVAKGFTQVYGIDYEDTFAPVARFETVRILLALAALEDWDIEALNVKTAYLYGSLDEEIYMDQPEGYIKKGQERKVCRLLKSLYGLKQSALQWNKEIHKALVNLGFTCTRLDAGVYFKFIGADIIVIVIYVDDVLLMGSDKKMLKKNKEDFMKVFETRDLGEAKEYLGMCITRDCKKRTINLDQCAYAEKVLKCFGLQNAKPARTPLPTGYNPTISDIEATSELRSQYQSVIGSLLYIMLGTRPDLAFVVIHMSQFCANPSQEHLSRALYIVRYLGSTKYLTLKFNGANHDGCLGYTDSD
jgi:hypothetical protein